ncbi:Nucleotide-sugar transporter family protein isoform 1 [Hibiscus syriacus]|uniref:Nucleotide-sugar transporter family protein isoform 1 n=1 Tax=Hibiscus syriacus TaxID=106335 RepID=A0A6A3D264_HIBSY|nr:Nucleotide-sugar transporter family protein isoform 1 [Hibiscus syriacus]
MATEPQLITIPNPENPTQTIQLINISHPSIIKLTSSNYLAWKLQIEAILIGYDLYKYIDNTHPCPPRTITTNNVEAPNLAFLPWIRQDKLLFGALVDSISSSLIPLIQQSATSREAWQILANTYACPTRDIVEGRDTPISIDELHEKLINRELTIQQSQFASFPHPVTANAASTRSNRSHRFSSNRTQPSHSTPRQQPSQPPQATTRQPRPYLGKLLLVPNPLDLSGTQGRMSPQPQVSKPQPGFSIVVPLTMSRLTSATSRFILLTTGLMTSKSMMALGYTFPKLDLLTWATLVEGQPKGGVYELPISHLTSRPSVFTSTKVSSCAWHRRLDHPSKSIQRHIISNCSTPCVFLGFSLTQSVYLCLDPSTQKVYISHHVRFVESEFPMSKVDPHLPRPDELTCDTWLPRHVILLVSYTSSEVSFIGSLSVDSNTQTDMVDQQDLPLPLYLPSPDPPHTSPTSPNTVPPLLPTPTPAHTPAPNMSLPVPLALPPPVPNQISKIPSLPPFVRTSPIVTLSRRNLMPWFEMALGNWYKARLVTKGFHQRLGVDYHETFSTVVKPTTVRVVLSLVVSQGWVLRQLDVNNVFLQGTLTEDVFMTQPQGFVDADHPHHVCKLRKAIYGFKQAPRVWYNEFRQFILESHFLNSVADTSLFILNDKGITIMLLVYVDDIIITGNNATSFQDFISVLARRFLLKDLSTLHYFLGVESPLRFPPLPSSLFSLRQHLLTQLNFELYSLQYLSLTRPDIAYVVNKLSQYMHRPTTEHWNAVKRLLRYLCGTIDHGIMLHCQSPLALHAYSDADWAINKDDFTSTSAYIVYIGRNSISWSSKKQRTVARSSTKAEYRSVASTAAEVRLITSLLSELGFSSSQQPVIYCDNVGATNLCSNPVFHYRMKHVALDFHFIREQVQDGILRVTHVSSMDQLADALTKPLPRTRFHDLLNKIGLTSRCSNLRGHNRESN